MLFWIRITWRLPARLLEFFRNMWAGYDELVKELEGIEEINYRLIRGLAQILERRCEIDTDAVIDSIAARKMVFEESRGFVTNLEERERVLDKIARKLSIDPDDLEKQQVEEIAKLSVMEISFDSYAGVISLDEVALRYGVSLDALKEVIKGQNKPGYSLLGDHLVSNQVLETIQVELIGVTKHSDVLKIFERYGIKAYSQTLCKLGYKVK
jgi:transcriptional regulator with XRE-family HTH domain